MTVTLAKWTIEEYHSMIKAGLLDNRQVELLRGKIVEMSPEGEAHAYFSSEAEDYLRGLLGDRATIRSGKPITLPDDSEPEPDIARQPVARVPRVEGTVEVAVVQKLGREYLQHHPYPENIFWLIEYSNTSLEKDLNVKTKIYAEAGIEEYWVVNLKKRQLIVFREPQETEYASKSTLSEGVIYPSAFPDLVIEVQAIVSR